MCVLASRGLDNRVYYMLAPAGQYYNYSGCGNTMNCNHPVTRQFILDSLKYWVTEMHVDGFRWVRGQAGRGRHPLFPPTEPLLQRYLTWMVQAFQGVWD